MKDNVECLMLNVKLKNSKFKIQNSKLPHRGFSMVELIFVIVLMGVLASIGGNLLPDNRLLNATNYVSMKIKETQKNALGNDINGFGAPWSKESNTICITLNKVGFEEKDKSSTKPFKFDIVDLSSDGKLCFDEYGRPYDVSTAQLLLVKKDINVTYNGKVKLISVLPMSGYVTLSD